MGQKQTPLIDPKTGKQLGYKRTVKRLTKALNLVAQENAELKVVIEMLTDLANVVANAEMNGFCEADHKTLQFMLQKLIVAEVIVEPKDELIKIPESNIILTGRDR